MPVLLVRHAAAVSRRSWAGDDVDRPLDGRGRTQASALVDALRSYDTVRVHSSPAVRCIDTVRPLAAARGLEVVCDGDLFEGNGHRALDLVRSLLTVGAAADGPAVALCSHGDVIPEVLEALARQGTDLGGERRCRKGSTWVLHRDGDTLSARYLPPPV